MPIVRSPTKQDELLIAAASASPPEGCVRWTLRLMARLADHDGLSR
jgi:hypothetical protein